MHHLIYPTTVKDWNCFFPCVTTLQLRVEGLLLRPGSCNQFFRCVRISIHLPPRHVKPPQAHLHVNALTTRRRKPIFGQRQLDLKLFSDAVRRFIPTLSNLHGALSVLSSAASLLRLNVWREDRSKHNVPCERCTDKRQQITGTNSEIGDCDYLTQIGKIWQC